MTNIIILLSTIASLFLGFWIISLLTIKKRNKLNAELLNINVNLSQENAKLEYQNAQNKIQLENFKKEAKNITDDLLELKNKVINTLLKYSRLLSNDEMQNFLLKERIDLGLSLSKVSNYTGIGETCIWRIEKKEIGSSYKKYSTLFNFYKDVRQGKIVLDSDTTTKE